MMSLTIFEEFLTTALLIILKIEVNSCGVLLRASKLDTCRALRWMSIMLLQALKHKMGAAGRAIMVAAEVVILARSRRL